LSRTARALAQDRVNARHYKERNCAGDHAHQAGNER
jgi:hypothetical protein